MANINIKISDEVHKQICHERINTKKGNGEIIETAVKFYFRSKGIKFLDDEPTSQISQQASEE